MTPVQTEWARCRDWIKAAVEPTGFYEIEDIEHAIASGEMQFWPGKDCAAVTQFVTYPSCKVLNVFAGGGERGKALRELTREMEPAFVKWAKASDCKWIIGFGIKETWKSICEGMGYQHLWTVMAKKVGE